MTAAASTGTHKAASTKEERKVSVPCTGPVNVGPLLPGHREGTTLFLLLKMFSLNLTHTGVFLLPFYAFSLF